SRRCSWSAPCARRSSAGSTCPRGRARARGARSSTRNGYPAPGRGRPGRPPSRGSAPAGGSPTARPGRAGRVRRRAPAAATAPPGPLRPPAEAEAAARSGQARTLAGPPLGMPSLIRVLAVGAAGHHVVIAAVSYAEVRDSLATLVKVLAIGTPLLFGLLALAT